MLESTLRYACRLRLAGLSQYNEAGGWRMEFSSDKEMQKIPELAREFFEHILFDEEPLFVGDEATIWDVSLATPEDLVKRCSEYYQTPVSEQDLRQPLWKLVQYLDARRNHRPQ
jgi:hypothetical protein